ncbi:MAG: hypothetical protein LAT61_11775 [Alcanivorax sp.]|nr:hypothetical protein [Alcanivorax sp.]
MIQIKLSPVGVASGSAGTARRTPGATGAWCTSAAAPVTAVALFLARFALPILLSLLLLNPFVGRGLSAARRLSLVMAGMLCIRGAGLGAGLSAWLSSWLGSWLSTRLARHLRWAGALILGCFSARLWVHARPVAGLLGRLECQRCQQ